MKRIFNRFLARATGKGAKKKPPARKRYIVRG